MRRVIPTPFEYVRARSVSHAVDLLGENGDRARLLAGGQSLLPMMKLRLAFPEVLVDVGDLDALRFIRRDGETVVIGGATRYADLLDSDVIRQSVPLIARAARRVGDAQIRYRGTLGGAMAHADPAADLPAAVLALDGVVIASGAGGSRAIRVEDFFVDYYRTALAADEIVTEVRLSATGSEKCWYERFSERAAGWPIVAVAVAGTRIALAGLGPIPLRAAAAEDVLATGGDFAGAAELAAAGTSPASDHRADADYRRHLARVLTYRALLSAHAR